MPSRRAYFPIVRQRVRERQFNSLFLFVTSRCNPRRAPQLCAHAGDDPETERRYGDVRRLRRNVLTSLVVDDNGAFRACELRGILGRLQDFDFNASKALACR